MRYFADKIVYDKYEPENTNVVWVQPTEEGAQIKAYIDGEWQLIGYDYDAYRKPASGIPESDLEESVRNAIDNAQHLDGKIDDEIERSERVDASLDERLGIVEQLADISISGGDATIATASDFNNPTAAQKAYIPTVGAILDGADTTPTSGSGKLVTSGGVYNVINSLKSAGYIFKGIATPSTSPGTPDYNVAYIGGAGTYANFGSSITIPVGTIGVFKYNGSWTQETIKLFDGIDAAPTLNSTNLVQSGGVYKKMVLSTSTLETIDYERVAGLIVKNDGLIQSVSTSYYIVYYEATAECDVELTFTRNDTYTYNGKIFIAPKTSIVAGQTVSVIEQVSVEQTIKKLYHLTTGQCLCVTSRSSDVVEFDFRLPVNSSVTKFYSNFEKSAYVKEGCNLIELAKIKPNTIVNGTTGLITSNNAGWRTIEIKFIRDDVRIYMEKVFSGYCSFVDANGSVIKVEGNTYNLGWGYKLPTGTVLGRFSFINTLTDSEIENYAYLSYNRPLMQDEISNRVSYENSYTYRKILRPTDYSDNDISAFKKILCIGDSITWGTFNADSGYVNVTGMNYPANLAKITGCDVTNLGDAGESASSWWSAHQNDTELTDTECVIIELGINDDDSTLDTVTKTAMDAIITKLKTENQKVKIFISGIPSGKSYAARLSTDNYYAKDQWLKNYYETYFASDNQVFFLDMARYTHICEKYNRTFKYDDYNQGHMSEYGYWRLAKDYANYVSYIMHESDKHFYDIQFIGTDNDYT